MFGATYDGRIIWQHPMNQRIFNIPCDIFLKAKSYNSKVFRKLCFKLQILVITAYTNKTVFELRAFQNNGKTGKNSTNPTVRKTYHHRQISMFPNLGA
jgi:hypothetical protein